MIIIHAFPDGTFKTSIGSESPWADHCRESSLAGVAGVRTFISDKAPGAQAYKGFCIEMLMGEFRCDEYLVEHCGSKGMGWMVWIARCMVEFGAWFTEMTEEPPAEKLRNRLLRLIETRGEVSEGILLNLVRPISWHEMLTALEVLTRQGRIKGVERKNPRNHIPAIIYSLNK